MYKLAVGSFLAFATGSAALAGEGMWTPDNLPVAQLQAKYGFTPGAEWTTHAQHAALRLAGGCSGSFVSPNGLVLTNHHCVNSCVQQLSTAEKDFIKSGFLAKEEKDEIKCPEIELNRLDTIADVTARVKQATAGKSGEAYSKADKAIKSEIEKECVAQDSASTRCDVVDLYHGGVYALYRYHRYQDVRLVFAPEFEMAFFGGDPDNFNFPRYSLDFAFLRLYDDDRPAVTPQHLRWSTATPREGEPTFVAGNPATTLRQMTVAQLLRQRDQALPILVGQLAELRGRLLQYSETDPDQAEAALAALNGVENYYKVFNGQLAALLDDGLIQAKRAEEDDLRQAVAADPELSVMGDPWAEIEHAQAAARDLYPRFRELEASAGGGSALFSYARTIVRVVQERAKPPEERRPGYNDVYFAALSRRVAADKPIQPDLERLNLTYWLQKTRELLTVDDPNVRALLGDESPEALAERLVRDTALADPETRVALLAMTPEQLTAQGDPLIAFVMANDTAAQLARTEWELAVDAPVIRAQERIARARYAVHGDEVAPDATFTLRLSYGRVAGWTQGRRTIAPFTRLAGLYDRATGAAPFRLPESWIEAREAVNPQTPLAYVTTNDITNGNSGSPVLNPRGEVVGTAFDGNIHSIAGAFAYDGRLNRTVVLSTAVIAEALREVYGQTHLLKELGQR